MFRFSQDKDYKPFDGIILSLEKGSGSSGAGVKTYRTIGDFDFLSISPVPIGSKDIKNSRDFMHHLSERLKDASEDNDISKNEDDSSYQLIGLAMMPGSDDFWKEEDETAYTFVSLLQFGGEPQPFNDHMRVLTEYLDNKTNKKRNPNACDARYFLYYSMDVSELILFIKTDSLEAGRKLLQVKKELDCGIHCYSHMGLVPDKLRNSTDLIKEAIISSTVCNPKKYRQWKDAWNLPADSVFERLGCEDFSIRLQDIQMQKLILHLNDGLLSPEPFDGTKGYKTAIMRPRIILDYKGTDDFSKRDNDVCEPTILGMYKKEYEGKTGKGDITRHMRPSMRLALFDMFKAVSMLEKNFYGRDVVQCIKSSYKKFILELKNENERIDKALNSEPEYSLLKVNRLNLHRYLSEYLDANMSIIRGALQAERMFFQVPGFNVKLYDLQSKLVVFYAAYIKKLKTVLNDKDPGFDVVFNVGLHPQITVEELFSINEYDDSFDNGALTRINVPISSMYLLDILAMQIAHEIAHFSANNFRLRLERLKQIINIVSAMLTDMFFGGRQPRASQVWVEDMEYLFPTINEQRHIAEKIHDYIKDFIDKELSFYKDERQLMTVNVKANLTPALAKFAGQVHMEPFLLEICEEIQKRKNPSNHEMPRFVNAISTFVCAVYENMEQIYSENLPVTHICKLVEESYSDFIMLKVSGVDADEYLKSFTGELDKIFVNSQYGKIPSDYTPQRICSVFKACYPELQDVFRYLEHHPKINTTSGLRDQDLEGLKNSINSVIGNGDDEISVSTHKMLVKYTVAYLNECSKEWDKYFSDMCANADKIKALDEAKKVYKWATGSKTLEDFINNFLELYESFVKDNTLADASNSPAQLSNYWEELQMAVRDAKPRIATMVDIAVKCLEANSDEFKNIFALNNSDPEKQEAMKRVEKTFVAVAFADTFDEFAHEFTSALDSFAV